MFLIKVEFGRDFTSEARRRIYDSLVLGRAHPCYLLFEFENIVSLEVGAFNQVAVLVALLTAATLHGDVGRGRVDLLDWWMRL